MQEEGITTVRLMARPGRIASPGQLMGLLSSLDAGICSACGKIRMLTDPTTRMAGAAFDLPEDQAERLLAMHEQLTEQDLTVRVHSHSSFYACRFATRAVFTNTCCK